MTAARFLKPAFSAPEIVRYNSVAQALHWTTAFLVFATLPIAWVMINMGRDNPWLSPLFLIHRSSASRFSRSSRSALFGAGCIPPRRSPGLWSPGRRGPRGAPISYFIWC